MKRLVLALLSACATSGCLSTMALTSAVYTAVVEPKTVDGGRWGYVVRGGHVQFQEPAGGFFPSPGVLTDLRGADARTFEVLDRGQTWAKDRLHVYHRAEVLDGADPATFHFFDFSYVGDARSIWYSSAVSGERLLEGVKVEAFHVLSPEKPSPSYLDRYATDGISVWIGDDKLEGVKVARFRVIGAELGTDGEKSYLRTMILPGVVGAATPLEPDHWADDLRGEHWLRDDQGSVFYLKTRYGAKPSDLVRLDLCDRASFRLSGPYPDDEYGLDDKCAFFGPDKLPLTDRASWRILSGSWSKDSGSVFWRASRQDDVDAESAETAKVTGSAYPGIRDKTGRCWAPYGALAACAPPSPSTSPD